MLGGDKTTVESEVMPLVLGSFSKKAVLCGPVGCGMAVKAVNNALNTAHLLIGAEGLLGKFAATCYMLYVICYMLYVML
jgi:3-hydroxyisobutyrate dehydrogenase-like beta-hydroxyacid dehydrogenase